MVGGHTASMAADRARARLRLRLHVCRKGGVGGTRMAVSMATTRALAAASRGALASNPGTLILPSPGILGVQREACATLATFAGLGAPFSRSR